MHTDPNAHLPNEHVPAKYFHRTPRGASCSSLGSAVALTLAGLCLTVGPLSAATEDGVTASTASQQETSAASDRASQESATRSTQAEESGQRPIARLPDRYKVSTWIGKSVENADGEDLGTVEDMIMDDFGRLRYVVMKSDQLASDNKDDLIAVPTGLFEPLRPDQSNLVLDVSPSHMSGAPSFSSSDYPNMGREIESALIITYWVPEGAGAQDSSSQPGAERSAGSDDMSTDPENQGRVAGSAMEQQFAGKSGQRSQRYEPNRDMIYLPREKGRLFDKLDENGDGVIGRTEAEANERLSRQFDEINSYANQGISRSEFAAFEIKDASGSRKDAGAQAKDQKPGDRQPTHQTGAPAQSMPMDQ